VVSTLGELKKGQHFVLLEPEVTSYFPSTATIVQAAIGIA
jgi:hypothetical protein